ncbi:hypothetical protein [Uliginosibacterium sp. 31-12]|uniref:hypothetical protein n=1 Tax=Uliginosibacterium sp. 31-12 TaxID=3062781 RepID=UPI0026E3C775|nr:hypothetical protein [Uliginosibacterium sp. 31-12]MDO6384856.1 hypothetical protein [Uliginosibacterium sp. 31-12]
MLFACSTNTSASSPDPHLQLDPHIGSTQIAPPATPVPQGSADENERPLNLSPQILSTPPDLQLTPPIEAASPAPTEAPAHSKLLQSALQGLWLLTSTLLGLHLLREWLRVLRLRVLRPPRPLALSHARWPTISILVPSHGKAAQQIERLTALAGMDFDYPAECIHFVLMFDPAETGLVEAVAVFERACPGRVHPLPMMAGPNTTLATALHAAVANSIGTALVVLDQELPLARNWLRQSITPLLDPAIGCVLTRAVFTPLDGALSARLDLLADQADTLLASQNDALNLLLCGKARIRAVRRQAMKSLHAPDLLHAPDGASLILDLTRLGWQSSLLGEITRYHSEDLLDQIRSPRLHPALVLQSLRLASLLVDPRLPAGARRQGAAAFFTAALPLVWLINLACGIALYFTGAPLLAGLAILLCTACSFDPHGNPGPAFRIAAAARMAGVREEIRLLPLSWVGFAHRLLGGIILLATTRTPRRREHAQPIETPASEGAVA